MISLTKKGWMVLVLYKTLKSNWKKAILHFTANDRMKSTICSVKISLDKYMFNYSIRSLKKKKAGLQINQRASSSRMKRARWIRLKICLIGENFHKTVKPLKLRRKITLRNSMICLKKYSIAMTTQKLSIKNNFYHWDRIKDKEKLTQSKMWLLWSREMLNGLRILESNNIKDITTQQSHGHMSAKMAEKLQLLQWRKKFLF